ncbi:MAG: M16 family metallopeptidase [Nannocystaceae bacterium]
MRIFNAGTYTFLAAALCLGTLSGCDSKADTQPPDMVGPAKGPAPTSASAVWPDEPFRAERPKPGPVPETPQPTLETFTLDNGLEVYLVHQDILPTVTMNISFEAGSVDDPGNKIGRNDLCFDLLSEGTKNLDKVAFETQQADHAVSIYSYGGSESSSIGVSALKDQLGPALDLLAEMLREPGMRAEDLDRLRKRNKASVLQAKGSPSSISRRVLRSLVWGGKHPYGGITTEKSLSAISLGDCKAVVKKLKPKGARMFVAGKVTADEIKQAFNTKLGFWKGSAPKSKKVAKAKPGAGTIYLIHSPGAAQSMISVATPGPERTAEDYVPTQMMATILGGSFSSRINMNLREDKGYAYGGRGSFRYYRGGSHFVAGSSVRTDATGPSLREISKELAGMRSAPVTDVELTREREGALLALPARFATARRTLSTYSSLVFYGLPLDWYTTYQAELKKLDAGAIQKAANDYLPETGYVVLVVGDAEVVYDDLKAIAGEKLFGDGGIKVLDADGKPTKLPEFSAKPKGD